MKKRIISRLEIKNNFVVKGIRMEGLRKIDHPWNLIKKYYYDGADEIIISDIVASLYGRNSLLDLIKITSQEIDIPICVGGGIRSIEDIKNLLYSGADKVSLNSFAVKNNQFISDASNIFGSQCILIEIHAKQTDENKWEVFTENGREPSGLDVCEWICKAQTLGAGEILLVSVDKDGSRSGFDLKLAKQASEVCEIPLTFGSGASQPSDALSLFNSTNIDAVFFGNILHFNLFTIKDIKNYLIRNKIKLRK